MYVGRLSARVRDRLWERVVHSLDTARAALVYSAAGEQGYTVTLAGDQRREVVDYDGFQLLRFLDEEV